jgi:hypothetical protein
MFEFLGFFNVKMWGILGKGRNQKRNQGVVSCCGGMGERVMASLLQLISYRLIVGEHFRGYDFTLIAKSKNRLMRNNSRLIDT